MASAAVAEFARAYARDAGYAEGGRYSPFDLGGASFAAHRGHGFSRYDGINNGALEFRCDGCGDSVFVLPPGA